MKTIQLDFYLFSLLDCLFLPSTESPVVSRIGESFQDYFRILKFNISQPLNSGIGISDLSPEIRNANDDLTQLSRTYFPISIGRTSLFQILGVLGGIFNFYSNSNRTFCEQNS